VVTVVVEVVEAEAVAVVGAVAEEAKDVIAIIVDYYRCGRCPLPSILKGLSILAAPTGCGDSISDEMLNLR
jgi:hypothetical protein